jgi:hypothetical protein
VFPTIDSDDDLSTQWTMHPLWLVATFEDSNSSFPFFNGILIGDKMTGMVKKEGGDVAIRGRSRKRDAGISAIAKRI